MRKLFLLTLALSAALVNAQEPVRGTIDLKFGWVKQADGTKKLVNGLKLNCIAYPIQAVPFKPLGRVERLSAMQKLTRAVKNPFGRFGSSRPGPLAADIQVYRNESTTEVGGIVDPEQFVNPSSLDDVTLAGTGVNKVWKKLRFAIHVNAPSSHQILIRWRIFDTSVENPVGQMDYTDEIADFGGTFTPIDPVNGPTWVYEVPDIQSVGVVVPDGECYFAQQFRDTSDLVNGNGPFELDYYNVYNKDTLPSVGTTTDGFIFDNNFLDGIYENGVDPGEFDVFATQPPPFANLLLSVWINSTAQQNLLQPNTLVRIKGVQPFGGVSGFVFDNDNNTYRVNGERASPTQSAVELELTSGSPTTAITSLRIVTRTKVKGGNIRQLLEAYHYGTSSWKLLDTRPMPNDQWVDVNGLYGGASPLSGFVGPGNVVKARLRFRPLVAAPTRVTITGDLLNWYITRG